MFSWPKSPVTGSSGHCGDSPCAPATSGLEGGLGNQTWQCELGALGWHRDLVPGDPKPSLGTPNPPWGPQTLP